MGGVLMAKYTTELHDLIASGYDLGMVAYPIFDEAYRPILNRKILEHYWFREIGLETADRFKWFLNVKLNEVMPYYNLLYESTILNFNPLHTFNQTETTLRETEGNSTGESSGEGKSIDSDTPQGNVSIATIESGGYASNVNVRKSEDASASSATGKEEYERVVTGYAGSNPSDAVLRFRETLINLDMLIIGEFNELFMGVF